MQKNLIQTFPNVLLLRENDFKKNNSKYEN